MFNLDHFYQFEIIYLSLGSSWYHADIIAALKIKDCLSVNMFVLYYI